MTRVISGPWRKHPEMRVRVAGLGQEKGVRTVRPIRVHAQEADNRPDAVGVPEDLEVPGTVVSEAAGPQCLAIHVAKAGEEGEPALGPIEMRAWGNQIR